VQAQMRSVDGIRFAADGEFKGDNRFPGIRIPVYLKPADPPAAKPAVADDVKDDKGKKGNKKKPAEPFAASVDTTSRKAPAVNIDKELMKVYVMDASGDTIRYINTRLKE